MNTTRPIICTLPNHNPYTGFCFGYISSNSLDPELVQELQFGRHSTDHSYEEALKEAQAKFGEEFDEDKFNDSYMCEEPNFSGTYEGISYQSSWLGGALNFFITESPILGWYHSCSPCVPHAGNLNQPGGLTECYDVPRSWLRDHEDGHKACQVIVHVRGGVLNAVYSDNPLIQCRAVQHDDGETLSAKDTEILDEATKMLGVF